MICVNAFLLHEIENYNMDYYHGKDNGAFVQFESILVFAILFYFFLSKQKKIINAFIGLGVGIVGGITSYLIVFQGVLFPIIACLIIITVFVLKETVQRIIEKKNRR